MYFTCDFETLGKYETFVLKPGGDEILVSESNKLEYIGYIVTIYLFTYLFCTFYYGIVQEYTKMYINAQ